MGSWRSALAAAVGVALFLVPHWGSAEDWPGWRGAKRDGISTETGLLKEWPEEGPPLVWKAEGLGIGYSGPAIVGDVLYTMGQRDNQDWVLALDLSAEGKQLWATPLGQVRHDGSGYPGPRATPTFDDGKLYTISISGDLACLDAKSGKLLWKRDLENDFGGKAPPWGYAESPLVDGNLVLFTPGGQKATLAAVSKTAGKPVWAAPIGDGAGYSSIVKTNIAKVNQYVQLTAKGIVGVDAKSGRPLWRYDGPANDRGINITTPVVLGQTVCSASGYGHGGGTAWIKRSSQGYEVDELWFTKDIKNHHGGLILLDGYLYGANDPGMLTCIEYKTGKTVWQNREPGKCSLLYADGMLYCRSEKGPLTLVEATPEEYRSKGRFEQPSRSDSNAWPHPVIANGMLYLRDQDVLLCYDVRAK